MGVIAEKAYFSVFRIVDRPAAMADGATNRLSDAGHMAPLDNPAGFAAALSDFLDR